MQPNPFELVRSDPTNSGKVELHYRKPDNFNGRDWSHGWIIVIPSHEGPIPQGQYGPMVFSPEEALRVYFDAYDSMNAYTPHG